MAQQGYIFKKSGSWFVRYRDDVMIEGQVKRVQKCERLAPVCDKYRSKKDVRGLRDEFLLPINSGSVRPESTLTVAEFAENHWLPWATENCKPSTVAGYKTLWETYLKGHIGETTLREFRTVDAANLFAEIHRQHKIGRSTLLHCKSRLSGIFTLARNKGALDAPNPIQGAAIPTKATAPAKTHAATPDEVMSIMSALEESGELRALAAVGLMFFAGLRPGEARGACWQDFDGKRLFVRQSVWHTHTTAPKTADAVAHVPVIDTLAEILARLREADNNPADGPILRGPSGKPINLDNLSKRVVAPILARCAVCKKVKDAEHEGHAYKRNEELPEWFGWYSLRRGVATTLAGLTRDGMASKGLLRHTNLATTTRHYVKDVPENTLAAMDRLENLFNQCATGANERPN